MKTSGLDALMRIVEELEKAIADLDGIIVHQTYNPHDPQSIEQAIQEFYLVVDERIAGYAHNETVDRIAVQCKEQGRNVIIEHAAKARLAGEN